MSVHGQYQTVGKARHVIGADGMRHMMRDKHKTLSLKLIVKFLGDETLLLKLLERLFGRIARAFVER